MIIHGPNIHHGGGKVLLDGILSNANQVSKLQSERLLVHLDSRFPLKEYPQTLIKLTIRSFRASLLMRLMAEWALMCQTQKNEIVLCFGNLPPLLPNRGKVILFFQNTLLLPQNSISHFPLRSKLRLMMERFWLRLFIYRIQKAIVQSEATKSEFLRNFPKIDTKVLPFASLPTPSTVISEKEYDFIYVASGDPHKNHKNLLAAWQMLADEKKFPHLCLTIHSKYLDLHKQIDLLKAKGCKITNFDKELPHAEVLMLYQNSRCLIFPSITESFGLPLIEAASLGLQIIASNKNYVTEIVMPDDTFEAESAKDIKDTVLKYLSSDSKKRPLSKRTKVVSPEVFIEEVLK